MKTRLLVVALLLPFVAEGSRRPAVHFRNPDPFEVFGMIYPEAVEIVEVLEEAPEPPLIYQHIPLRPEDVLSCEQGWTTA